MGQADQPSEIFAFAPAVLALRNSVHSAVRLGPSHPAIHREMLNRGYAFDTVQMPLNPLEPNFRRFESNVLPVADERGIAALGMKSMSGSGELI